ncbi:putative spermidine/putrescine transport system permease protein [Curtobacterium sp. PhB42]|uniref:ABC transporter permease subunit n=1 Tax=unclassified Curtobacterium TaxID=257496 RepID=UPI0010532A7C|nr:MULTISPECIES: ABC transporter permease subunit [unclassified Curtobacterium]TCU87341.1 putative spermidine/putrescine transport system permease protein [Curtobacterium sp. PhB191]TDW49310.1 putative spermidine/putrescine transport system permease protein [Curtobacterium sp. PhB42]TDW56653.1 putative spermidine/putrescine transport system permease protein [Curtobacterium sp. PhB190]
MSGAAPVRPVRPGGPSRVGRFGTAPSRGTATAVLTVVGIVFAVPLAALVQFTFRQGTDDGLTFAHWAAIVDPVNAFTYQPVFDGLGASLLIAVITVGIVLFVLLPTQIITALRYPRLRRVLEFVCIVPITVPVVVLVVGFIPVYQVVSRVFGSGAWTLAFAIGIVTLPFAFRPIAAAITATDLTVLSEAARSLGASWWTVTWRVLLPNLRRGITAACFLTITVVLGEYTLAAFLSRTTFQTALVLVQQTDPYVAAIFSVAALVFGFVLLVVIGRIGTGRRAGRTRTVRTTRVKESA